MLKINCVVVGGKLVGKTVSDRWNLDMIGYGLDKSTSSQAAARRLAQALDCSIVVHRADQTIKAHASKLEVSSLGRKLSAMLRWVA